MLKRLLDSWLGFFLSWWLVLGTGFGVLFFLMALLQGGTPHPVPLPRNADVVGRALNWWSESTGHLFLGMYEVSFLVSGCLTINDWFDRRERAKAQRTKRALEAMRSSESKHFCGQCAGEHLCEYFEFIVCRVVEASTTGWNIGTSRGWDHSSTYTRIGSGGGYLCRSCGRKVFLKQLYPWLLLGTVPVAIWALFFRSERLWWWYGFMLAGVAWGLLKVVLMRKDEMAFAVQELCRAEVTRQFGYKEVWTGMTLPSHRGGVRLFTPDSYKALLLQNSAQTTAGGEWKLVLAITGIILILGGLVLTIQYFLLK